MKFLFLYAMSLLSACSFTYIGRTNFNVEKNIAYTHESDKQLQGDIYVPKGDAVFPAVLLVHGGSWAGGSRWHMNGIAKELARSGFVVFNISYRLAPANLYPAQIEDLQHALKWMKDNSSTYKIDSTKIAAYGYSAGGQLAALLGTLSSKDSPTVQAVVAGSGPHNLIKYPDSPAVVRLLGTTIDKNPGIFRDASPLFHVGADTPPMFLYHGLKDRTVDLSHTTDMKKKLDAVNVYNEMYLIEGYGHVDLFLFSRSAVTRAVKFLQTVLLAN